MLCRKQLRCSKSQEVAALYYAAAIKGAVESAAAPISATESNKRIGWAPLARN